MGFWIFMLVIDLLIPLTMIGFGRMFLTKIPKDINALFGYRTSMSMKNAETWEFAHNFCGRIWFVGGLIMLPLSIIPLLFFIGGDEDTVSAVGSIVAFVQMIPLIGAIFPTEAALKKNFDENGKRR